MLAIGRQRLRDDASLQFQLFGGEEKIGFGKAFGAAAEWVGELRGVGGDAVELGQQHQAQQTEIMRTTLMQSRLISLENYQFWKNKGNMRH